MQFTELESISDSQPLVEYVFCQWSGNETECQAFYHIIKLCLDNTVTLLEQFAFAQYHQSTLIGVTFYHYLNSMLIWKVL